ncbi:glycosyltransferase family 4 protein [Gammaproteobacteria bacterium]|nr:glycosyltransferase family 4 protein [Gammaproteobacteria bacterium]
MIWVAFLVTALISLVCTGLIRHYAQTLNFVAVPNQRSSHTQATPHGGGVAIVLSFQLMMAALAYSGVLPASDVLIYLLAGSWIALVGLLDDFRHIPARWRLLAHFTAATFVLFWLDGMPALLIAGGSYDLGWFTSLVAIVFLVWLLNLYNFMDGIDGIAGIEALSVCLGGVFLYWLYEDKTGLWIIPMMLAVATIGFLFWNFPKARIFMGDSGSGFVGFVIGIMALQASAFSSELIWCWLILLGTFIADASITLVRRVIRGEKFYEAHRSHAYQYASRKYNSHVPVSIAFGLINLLWLLPLSAMVVYGWLDGLLALLIAYLPLILLAFIFKAGAGELQEV